MDEHEQADASSSSVVIDRPRVVNVLRRHFGASISTLSTRQRRVLQQLQGCRRGGYGSRLHGCDDCDHGHVTLNSCGNRHCPCCGDGRRDGWRERMAEIALDVPYLHVVFTTPHELNEVHDLAGSRPLIKLRGPIDTLENRRPKTTSNDSEMIRLLFDSAIAALKKGCKDRGIEELGAVMTLHTWGQRMKRHVHLHVVLIAGGLAGAALPGKEATGPGAAWVPLAIDDDALLSLRDRLASVYRKQYTSRFRRRVKTGRIRMPGVQLADETAQLQAAQELTGKLANKAWIVDLQASPAQWSGSEGIVNYLASYVAGTAISDARMVSDDGNGVTIKLKDYRTGAKTTETMPGVEFVARFASHILPLHSRRIRYVGLFASKGRGARLNQCRRLIDIANQGEPCRADPPRETEDEPFETTASSASRRCIAASPAAQPTDRETTEEKVIDERLVLFTGEDNKQRRSYPARCRMCQRPMEPLRQLDGRLTLAILPYLIQVIAWLNGKAAAPPEKVPLMVPRHFRKFVADEQRAEQRRRSQPLFHQYLWLREHPPP